MKMQIDMAIIISSVLLGFDGCLGMEAGFDGSVGDGAGCCAVVDGATGIIGTPRNFFTPGALITGEVIYNDMLKEENKL